MSQIRRLASADFLVVFVLSMILAGCGDGQHSDWVSKLKALTGGQGASPTVATEPDPEQARQKEMDELQKKAEAGDALAMVELGKAFDLGRHWGKPILFYYIDTGDNDPLLDREKAAAWYGKAAEKGNVEASGRPWAAAF